jgi:hypothetical protein
VLLFRASPAILQPQRPLLPISARFPMGTGGLGQNEGDKARFICQGPLWLGNFAFDQVGDIPLLEGLHLYSCGCETQVNLLETASSLHVPPKHRYYFAQDGAFFIHHNRHFRLDTIRLCHITKRASNYRSPSGVRERSSSRTCWLCQYLRNL